MSKVPAGSDPYHRAVQYLHQSFNDIIAGLGSIDTSSSQGRFNLAILSKELDLCRTTVSDSLERYLTSKNLPPELTIESVTDKIFEFQTIYNKSKAQIEVLLMGVPPARESLAPVAPSETTVRSEALNANMSVSLPKFKLPTFGGDYLQFDNFWSRFDTLVNQSSSLTKLEKFEYLQTQLHGPALEVIKHLPFTDTNYESAVKLIKDRYANPRRALSLHANNIINLPRLTSSISSIRTFLDSFNAHFNAIANSGAAGHAQDVIFVQLLLSKFTAELRDKFESYSGSSDGLTFPKLDQLLTFLNKQVTILENATFQSSSRVEQARPKHPPPRKSAVTTLATTVAQPVCGMCKGHHVINYCSAFLKKSPRERADCIKPLRLCAKCLRGHGRLCNFNGRCQICKSTNHHTLLHFPKVATNTATVKATGLPVTQSPTDTFNATTCMTAQPSSHTSILMATALIRLEVESGKYVIARAILDTASHASFLSESCAQKLKCNRTYSNTIIQGVGDCITSSRGHCTLAVASIAGNVLHSSHSFMVLPSITNNTPRLTISPEVKLKARNLVLADPTFDLSSPIDALLGADLTAIAMQGSIVPLGTGFPVAVNTHFGWVLMGSAPVNQLQLHKPADGLSACMYTNDVNCPDSSVSVTSTFLTTCDDDVHSLLKRFWEIEEPPPLLSVRSADDEAAEHHFQKTTARTSDGRYVVRLPFKNSNLSQLPNNYKLALGRFKNIERKMNRDPQFKSAYHLFMEDYINRGHMIPIADPLYPRYFIPHHGIYRRHGDTSKLRVVFDATACDSTKLSLNVFLHCGPKLQPLIADVLTLFRTYSYVFTCDIEQMFRQILVHDLDRPYQCILWRASEQQPIQIYALATVTYGVVCSPYLALRTIKQLVLDEGHSFPLASNALTNTTFVDDIIAGGQNMGQAAAVKSEIVSLLAKGCFELKKWFSNCPDLISDFQSSTTDFDTRILGIAWNLRDDLLHYPTHEFILPESPVVSKRRMLMQVAKLYDPNGWISPIVMRGKCFLQSVWKTAVDWDTPIDPPLSREWTDFVDSLSELDQLSVPRQLCCAGAPVEIHGFCDASLSGYAAILYLKSTCSPHQCTILASKTKVAPIKPLTIPRLELLGALLLARLAHHYFSLLKQYWQVQSIYLWTDSTIVLHWLHSDPVQLKTFVANRIVNILELFPPHNWYHVPGVDNPADVASRGCTPTDLARSRVWWTGPPWLQGDKSMWPTQPTIDQSTFQHLEFKLPIVPSLLVTPTDHLFDRYSSWPFILKLCFLIAKWVCSVSPTLLQDLTLVEYAHVLLIKHIQRVAFATDLTLLSNGKRASPAIHKLVPFIDNHGLLRARGRLTNALCPIDTCPIILPKHHPLVVLLINYTHIQLHHAGPTQTHYQLRQKYWILAARQVIRSTIHKCVICFKARPTNVAPLMGDLPSDRVNVNFPFINTGMDYCGPFMIKASHLRKAPLLKIYVCVFICMSTKAIHLEIATELSTEAFLDALKRFINRRGCPRRLYSDCGTNFVGADKRLKDNLNSWLNSVQVSPLIHQFCLENNIEFHFNTPAAPHCGGLWERAVQSMKFHLKRVVGLTVLTLHQFNSIIIGIEGILNSRPITLLSAEPGDLQALSPAHFLIGRLITAPAEHINQIVDCGSVKHFRLCQTIIQHFWSRWQHEYLTTLNARSKWYTHTSNLRLNDVVVLEEPNSPPLAWPLGRITHVFPSKDGVVRKVEVATSKGSYTRPPTKLYRLPIGD